MLDKKRLERKKYSVKKLIIAKNAARVLSKIPSVKFVGITGSLAMMNSNYDSDIDLMIITKSGCLWSTRLISYLVNWFIGNKIRKPKDKDEKNKLCLNMWLDESDLVWDRRDRNIYTSHEIAQIVPLVNKNKIYEQFLYLNRWILNYWPNSVQIKRMRYSSAIEKSEQRLVKQLLPIRYTLYALEFIARQIQFWYMRSKITIEVVTPTRAIFHPNNWGKVVILKLKN